MRPAAFSEEGAMKRRGVWLAMMVGVVTVEYGLEGMLEKAAGKTADTVKDAAP